jgi:crotonobetainyl-CoA:carnitine CoA-transferase CaiB-like acyl-CoA transferase
MEIRRMSASSGVRVLELTGGLAGAYAGKLLRDAGLEVSVGEGPGGHPLRRRFPACVARQEVRAGLLFEHLTEGADFKEVPSGPWPVGGVEALLDGFDAVMCSPAPEGFADPALTPQALRSVRPDLVVVSISPFGLEGPWRDRPATEFTLQAMSGGLAARGPEGRPPVAVGGQHGDWVTGTFAAVGTLASLHRRDVAADGRGELVDVSALEALATTQSWNPLTYEGVFGHRWYGGGRYPLTPGDIEPTADGLVGFSLVNSVQHWHDFCAMIGQPDWVEDPVLDTATSRRTRVADLLPVIRGWTSQRTTEDIVELASMFRLPVAPLGNGRTLPTIEPFASMGTYQPDTTGTFLRPAPAFCVHDQGRKRSPTRTKSPGGRVPASVSRTEALPFAGVRILDFTAYWAGPSATHLFAMLGAEVIHIESPRRPDGARNQTPRTADTDGWWEWCPAFLGTNSDKLGVALDMGSAEGRELARELVAVSDVVVENFSPRVFESWNLGFEELRQLRPDLVMARMPAFELAGPWRDRTGFAMTMEQLSGMAWITGYPDLPPNAPNGPCDPLAGAHASLAIMAGLAERDRTGEAVFLEIPMISMAVNIAAEQVVEYSGNGVLLNRMGNRSPHIAPQNLYASIDDPDTPVYVALSVDTDERWMALRGAIGNPAWAHDVLLDSVTGRWDAHDQIDQYLAQWFAERTASEAERILLAVGVPCATVVDTSQISVNPQLRARGFIEELTDPVTGRQEYSGYPARFEHGPAKLHREPAPTLGRDNEYVVRSVLGHSREEYERYLALGILATAITREPRKTG